MVMQEEVSEYAEGGRQQSLADEILTRHRKSKQPESQQVCAVVRAVVEVVRAEGLEVTPTALFAALMSALENEATRATPEVATAVGTVLSTVLARTPSSVMRSKYQACSTLIADVLDEHMDKAPPLKAFLGCLAQLLAAVDPASWGPTTVRPWGMLLHLATDPRPKVRKRAATGIVEVLAAVQNTSALNVASEALQRACSKVFEAPEAAARAAAAASNKKRAEAEATIREAVSEALYMMGALKDALPLASASAAAGVSQSLIALYPLKQALLTRHATAVLVALADSSSSHLPGDSLAELLKVVLVRTDAWETRDVDALLSLVAFVGAAARRLHNLGHSAAGALVPRVVHALVQQLAAEQDGVRFGAAEELQRVLQSCVDEKLLSKQPGADGKPTPAQAVIAAVASALSPQLQDAWPKALPIVGSLLRQLGAEHAGMATSILERLDTMLMGAAEGMEEGDLDAVACQPAVESAMGAALQALGPEAVLEVLPLQLQEGLDGSSRARVWMLPLLRRHVRGARLGLWARVLLPLARAMGSQAAAAAKATSPGSAARAAVCRTLEMQLWHTLPAFANQAVEISEAFPAMARDLGTAFQNRADLRSPICLALGRLCRQVWRGVSEAGILAECGLLGSGPFAAAGVAEEAEDMSTPATETDALKANLQALQRFAPNFLSLMFNCYVEAEAEARGEIGSTIAAYASISPAPMLAGVFRTVVQKLIKVTQDANAEVATSGVMEGGNTPTERRCTFMELALCVAGGLDPAGINTLYKAALPGLKDNESAVQKKAYKMLAYICEEHSSFTREHAQEIVAHLVSGLPSAHPAVKRHRLRSVKALILLLDSRDAPEVALPSDAENPAEDATAETRRQVVASLVSEIVMCTKESNKKTRAAAYDLLVEIGKAMDTNRLAAVRLGGEAMVEEEDGAPASGLQNLFTMVMAGLVASHPHMVSATVTALARLVFEFANRLGEDLPQLLSAVLMLFRQKSREVVKACLGFVKVAVMRLPVWQLEPHVGEILEGVLLWASDTKNRFKLKVRTIVEALAKRCGYDTVAAAIPESDAKLLVHIRKTKERMARQKAQRRAGAGSVADEDEDMDDTRSRATSKASSRAKTARASEWGHTAIFSDLLDDDEEEDGGRRGGGAGRGKSRTAASTAVPGKKSAGGGGGRLRDAEDEPMDLLGQGAARDLMRASNSRKTDRAEDSSFKRSEDGRLVIAEEAGEGDTRRRGTKRGRSRVDDESADDESDGDDSIGKLTQAVKSGAGRAVKFANSVGGGSVGGRTTRTAGGRSSKAGSLKSRASQAGSNKEHSGDRFKPKRKGTGGDMKGAGGKVEPYAYWPLDKKMLNRRAAKKAGAKKGLDKVLTGTSSLRGNKAKRARL